MDAKITKKRLSKLFAYEWVKIIAVVMAAIFGWIVIFELTETRIKPSQKYTVFNHSANNALIYTTLDVLKNVLHEDVFSDEVLEIDYQDLKAAGMYSHTTIDSLLGVSDGDLMLVPNRTNPNSLFSGEDAEGSGEDNKFTYPESLISPYRRYVTYLDDDKQGGYFFEIKKYLNNYYTEGWEVATSINKAKIESDFRARVKKTKDKRYRKADKLKAGIASEIKRIEKYRQALEEFYGFINDGLIAFNAPSKLTEKSQVPKDYEGIISLNICPNEKRMLNLKNYFSYEDTEREIKKTAQDMSVVFFYNPDQDDSYEYESLLYVVDLIKKGQSDQ